MKKLCVILFLILIFPSLSWGDNEVKPLKIRGYVVAPGDSLWSISQSQNITLDTLIGSNTFIFTTPFRAGMIFRIPNQDGIFYTMRTGDEIETVCKQYGVDINKIKRVNLNVDIARLKAGDEIFLPSPAAP